ncbi:N-acetyltransferase family protein [Streptomyces sp. NPDC054796]
MPTAQPTDHDGTDRSGIDVRPMALDDLSAVLALGNSVYDTAVMPYTGWSLTAVATHLDASAPACRVAVSTDGGRLAGFVLGSMSFEQRDDWGYLEWIAVDPDFQGHGVAGRLVRACCEALESAGATCVVTDVEVDNTASSALMRRNGFTEGATMTLFVRETGDGAAHTPSGRVPRGHLARAVRPAPPGEDAGPTT